MKTERRTGKPLPTGTEKSFSERNMLRQPAFLLTAVLLLITLIFTYRNHFNNPFEFDDAHTIVNNSAIRSLHNIPAFFTDTRTTSSLPANQIYRPGLTALNAIDYWIGGKPEPDPFYYHVSIFVSYVLLGILLFFFLLKIFDEVKPFSGNKFFALFGAGFYCLHAANAETINYIIARSDSFSTLMIVLAFVIYQYKPGWRKKYIYILPVIIGFFVKEPTIMVAPLLFIYILFFGKKLSIADCFSSNGFRASINTLKELLPLFIFAVLLFILSKKMASDTFTPGGTSALHYILTQPFAIVHYVNNFILPVNLSADTDWMAFSNLFDDRVFVGLMVLLTMIIFSIYASTKEFLRPVSFGLLWFLLALLPTSVVPLAEVINDHRTFFPYIGLIIASVWSFALLVHKFEAEIKNNGALKFIFITIPVLILIGHSYGTMQRIETWSSAEKLWYDVTVKSPNNSRGLMNYANSLMAKGEFDKALDYYERSKKLSPGYSYLYINMAILKSSMGKPAEAEADFKFGLSLDSFNPEAYFYYGNWLLTQRRYREALDLVSQGLRISPEHTGLKQLSENLKALIAGDDVILKNALQVVKEKPTPENFLNLSLLYYQNHQYQDCVNAANEALKLRPDYAEAYNNICSAENVLGNFDDAVIAGQMTVRLQPGFVLGQNNLNAALVRKAKVDSLTSIALKNPNADNYVNLSLLYYNFACYQKCVDAATMALKYDPNSVSAYNNICSGYNMLEEWDKAIEAGEKGLKLNPENTLLKNNLTVSHKGKDASR
jgi:tetratricopeptide (TPR) repeat protein